MKQVAILAILLALTASSALSAPTRPKDPEPFLASFTPDGGRLVVASHGGGIKVLSVPDLKEIRSFALENGRRLNSAAVSPGGRWLAADDDVGDLLIWNLETGEAQPGVPVASRRWGSPIYLFRPGDDDTLLLYQQRSFLVSTLRLWNVKEGREGNAVKGMTNVDRMAMSPDGRYLLVGGMFGATCLLKDSNTDLCLYATDEMKVVKGAVWEQLFPREILSKLPQLADMAFTPEGRILVTVSLRDSDHRRYYSRFLAPDNLRVLEETNVNPDQQWQYPGIRSAPGDQLVAVSPDGRWKATASAFQKRLFLYRMTPDGPALERFIPIP